MRFPRANVLLSLLIASLTLTVMITYQLGTGTVYRSQAPQSEATTNHGTSSSLEYPKSEAQAQQRGAYYDDSLPERTPAPTVKQENKLDLDLLTPHVLVEPSWVKAKDWGLVENAALNISALPRPLQEVPLDGEVDTAWTHFFRGMTNGLMLELGAMNGVSYSASKPFEDHAGWKTILIEGQRSNAQKIPANRPASLSLQLIVCEQPTTYHFMEAQDVGGIIEFMAPDFLAGFHKSLLKDSAVIPQGAGTAAWSGVTLEDIVDWEKVKKNPQVFEEQCFPLQSVFDRFEITRINFMVLDLEGGELGALKSLDFDRIRFDVLCIETNRMNNDADPYIDEVIEFVRGKGYKLYGEHTIGRNTWFVHPDWTRIL